VTKEKKTSVERVLPVLMAAGDKGLTLNGLIDEVNLVNGEKVPQDDYLAKGPVMSALAEIADQWEVVGTGDDAIYKLKPQSDGAPATSADMLTPNEMLLARITLARKIVDGDHHAWKNTADQQALVNVGIAEVKTAEGGAQSIVLAEGAALRISLEGLRVWLQPTVPVVELGEPREDALARRAQFVARIHGETVPIPLEFSTDIRALINAGVIVVKDGENGAPATFVLTEHAEGRRALFGFRGLAEESLPPLPPSALPAPPVTASPEYKALAKQNDDLKKDVTATRAIEKALRQKLEEAVPSTKPRVRFTYTNQWTVKAGKPETRLAMMGRGLELSQLLQHEIQRAKNVEDGAKGRREQVQKNLAPKILELQQVGNLMTWEESIQNCTAHIIGPTVFVRDEYGNNIARFTITDCPKNILAVAERVEDGESKDEAKGPVEQKKEAPAPNSKTESADKAKVDEPNGDAAPKEDAGDDGSAAIADAPPTDGKPRIALLLSIEGFQAAIAHVLDEKGYVFEDELKKALEDASGVTIPESAKTFMDAALDAMKSKKEIKLDKLDDRAAIIRVGEPKVKGKPITSSAPKVSAAVLKKVLGACQRLAGDKVGAVLKIQDLVDASTCSEHEVECAMAKVVERGDAEVKTGRKRAWIWKGASNGRS
jgi:hypothetical protein